MSDELSLSPTPPPKDSRSNAGPIAGVVGGIGAVSIAVAVVFCVQLATPQNPVKRRNVIFSANYDT